MGYVYSTNCFELNTMRARNSKIFFNKRLKVKNNFKLIYVKCTHSCIRIYISSRTREPRKAQLPLLRDFLSTIFLKYFQLMSNENVLKKRNKEKTFDKLLTRFVQ